MGATTIDYGSVPFGGVDEFGVRWDIATRDGFQGWGSPAPTLDVQQNPRGNWGWAGESFLTPRHMRVKGKVFAPSAELLNDALDRLYDSVALEDRPFTVREAGKLRWMHVRRADEVFAQKLTTLVAEYSFQVVAPDGRKLHAELTGDTRLPSSSGGLTVPFRVPFRIDAVRITGQVSLANPGNIAGPVRLRIDGPARGPVITHVSSGRSLVFASSLVLGAGEWLDIDMDAQTVLANGQSNRRMYVTSAAWSAFERGDNTWALTAAEFNAGTRLTVFATPADK